MTRVVLASNTAWSLYNFRKNIIQYLLARGYEVFVCAPADKHVKDLEGWGCKFIDLPVKSKGTNPVEDLKLLLKFYSIYKTVKPDIVFHYTIKPNIYGSIAARLAFVPSIAVPTGLGYSFVQNNWISKISRFLYRFAFKFPDEVWFLNESDKAEFLSRKLVNASKVKILPGEGVDLNYFSPQGGSGKKNEKITFVLIARMLWDKGIGEYVQAARKLVKKYPNASFSLVGPVGVDNPSSISMEKINEWINEGVVKYHGAIDDVRPMILESDCVVLPSYREGISRILLESASMCKPIVATDVPGCRDLVRDGINGYLCKPKDSDDLVTVIDKFMELTAEEREKMGIAGRDFVRNNYSDEKVLECYCEALLKYEGNN